MPTDEHGEYWDYISSIDGTRIRLADRDPAGGIRGDAGLPLGRIEPVTTNYPMMVGAKPAPARLREYIIVGPCELIELCNDVEEMLNAGYVLIGGVAVDRGRFYQAMGC